MKCIRVYHADVSSPFRCEMRERVKQEHGMDWAGDTYNGLLAEEEIRKIQPDVVVASVELTEVDGLELLRRITEMPRYPRVIMVSHIARDFCIQHAMQLGAFYYMLKPCSTKLLCERIREVASLPMQSAYPTGNREPFTCEKLLREINVPSDLDGYRYICDAVSISARSPEESVTKTLYPSIARRYGTSAQSVERTIRHAILVAWGKGETPLRRSLFAGGSRPSNGVFIKRIAMELSLEESTHSFDPSPFL